MAQAGKLATFLAASAASIPRFINDEFLVCTVPQRLVIQHAKLGFLLRCMQLAMFIAVVYRLTTQQVWLKTSTPTPFAPLLYNEGGDPTAAQNDNVAHCKDTPSYWHKYDETWGFYPKRCEALEPGEMAVQRSSDHLFLPTYIMDYTVARGTGDTCGHATRAWCNSTKGALQESSSGCSCSSGNEFFAKNPEQQRLGIYHGYEVDTSGGEGTWVMRGKSEGRFHWKGPLHDLEEHDGTLMTIVLSVEGEPCRVDGRSTWTYEHAQWGIEGTLSEWLACAGVSLDTNPSSLIQANGLPKHLRTMGVSLQLHFDYRNMHDQPHKGVVCYVTVNALVQWTQIQPPADMIWLGDEAQIAKRTRLAFGVAIDMKVTGSFKLFSFSYLMLHCVETFVVFKIPLVITQLIALYFMGFLSVIYRRARQVKFNIFTHYRESIAKLVQAEVAFRALVGGVWKGAVANKELPMRHLYLHLCDAFDYHLKSGTLSKLEVRQMTSAIFCHLDFEGDGTIGCSDFVRSCTENDVFDLMTVANMLTGSKEGKDGGIITRLSDHSQRTDSSVVFDAPTEKHQEEWIWDEDEPDKEPLNSPNPNRAQLKKSQEPVAALEGPSPTFAPVAPLRDALQRIEALESLRIGQRLLSLEEKVIAPHEVAVVEPATPKSPRSPRFGEANEAGPQHQDLLPRILLLEKSIAQLAETLDQRMTEMQATLLPSKAQSAEVSTPAAGKLRQVAPTDSSVDENASGFIDRYERTRWTSNSVPPLMAAVDQAIQAIPPLGLPPIGREPWSRRNRNVSPGADEAGGVTPNWSREGPVEQRRQRSRSGDYGIIRPPRERSQSSERQVLQVSESSNHDKGESSSCAPRTLSRTTESGTGSSFQYRMESRIPILGFGESIPIELLDMKEHKRF